MPVRATACWGGEVTGGVMGGGWLRLRMSWLLTVLRDGKASSIAGGRFIFLRWKLQHGG